MADKRNQPKKPVPRELACGCVVKPIPGMRTAIDLVRACAVAKKLVAKGVDVRDHIDEGGK